MDLGTNDGKYIKDPIHGHIYLRKEALSIIDTPQFQRLRYLHQLGSSYLVYPGASHRRFEHSIGVFHLAEDFIINLKNKQPELELNDKDVLNVSLAGLCHDLGHGPFSHIFDQLFIKKINPSSTWTHEQGSQQMLEYLIDQNNIDIDAQSVKEIKEYIVGLSPFESNSREKGYLFDIVANKRNGLDVDKFDYLQRDAFNIGLPISFDVKRFLKFNKVADNQICYNQKEFNNVYELFHTRYSMFKRVYCHRVSRALDLMITDALLLADPMLKVSESIYDMEVYLHTTDNILQEIAKSKLPELQESKALIKRISTRQLYDFVDQVIIPSNVIHHINENTITESDVVAERNSNYLNFDSTDLILDWLHLSYGKGSENPVDSVKFYSKNFKRDFKMSNNLSYLIPQQFKEVTLRVFSKNKDKTEAIRIAFQSLVKKLNLRLEG